MAKNAQTDIKRFLIVDDNEESQVIVRALLSQLQIQSITMESSGEAALEQVEPKRIEFLIVNWDLGGKMSAGTFLQRIKSRNAFRHLPFTIYSESFDEDDLALAGLRAIVETAQLGQFLVATVDRRLARDADTSEWPLRLGLE